MSSSFATHQAPVFFIAASSAATFPLERIAQAQELFQQKGHVGKIVLEVG